MDEADDFEIPSPKRARVEARELDTYEHPGTPKDDMDDIYGTTQNLAASLKDLASTVPVPANPRAVPTSPPLPGLGMVQDEPQLSKEDEEQATQASEGANLLGTITSPEQMSDNKDSRHELAPHDGNGPHFAIENKATLNNDGTIYKDTSLLESSFLKNGENAGRVLQTGISAKDGVPTRSDEVILNLKLGQANIGSQSPREGGKSHTTLVAGATNLEPSAADGVQKGILQEPTRGPYRQ